MSRVRNELSTKNRWYIGKHRYLELKHFCLQYPEWKRAYKLIRDIPPSEGYVSVTDTPSDGSFAEDSAIRRAELSRSMALIERVAADTDEYLGPFLLRAVTEGLSFPTLQAQEQIACGRDMYFDRYRKFFWLLSREKGL